MTEKEEVVSIIGQDNFDNIENEDLTDDQYEKLFEYYVESEDMPYGAKKARTIDPWQWIYDRIRWLHSYQPRIVISP